MEHAVIAEKLTYTYPSTEENTLSLPVVEELTLQI